MNLFKNLSAEEKEEFLKFPAYISMLTASCDNSLDNDEKKAAIKLSHTATFACNPVLREFYEEADKVFEKNIEILDLDLPEDKLKREAAIKIELSNLEKILLKLGKEYAKIMHESMKIFMTHVSKAHHNVLMDFVFPIAIPGFED